MLTTDRLTLAEFTTADSAFILRLVNTPSWIKYIGERDVSNIAEAEQYLLEGPIKSYRDHGFGFYGMKLRSTGKPIGMCGLIKRDDMKEIDLGFALLPEFEGQGYALEAARAVLEYAAEKLGLVRLIAFTLPNNLRSISLLKRLGFSYEESMLYGTEKEEVDVFSISLQENFPGGFQNNS